MGSNDATHVRRLTAAGLVSLAMVIVFAQNLSSADPADQDTAKLVAQMIPKYHLNRQPINDKISSMLLDSFIKDLDPQKLYFLKSDIDTFESERTKLDDELKAGHVDFAYKVFDLYKQRIGQQTEVAHYWIDQDHDFTLDEYIETDGKKLNWCETQEELNDRWRRRIKFDLLQFKLDGEKSAAKSDSAAPPRDPDKIPLEQLDLKKGMQVFEKQTPKTPAEIMADARERLHKRYRNNKRLLDQYGRIEELEIYLTALAQCFDPHSSYMSPNSWEDFEIQMKLSLDGIGAALRSEDGYTVVASIVPGGAAAEDGRLKVEDKIIGVDKDGDGEIVDVFEMKLSEVVRMIRGPRGTVVRLQVKPKDGGESKTISLTRKKIELKESEVKGEIIDGTERLGRPGRIGVVSLPGFYRDFAGAQGGGEFKSAAADLAKVLYEFDKAKVDAVVIDLRSNGGGALTEAIEVSGHFIDRGPVVQVKEPDGHVQALDDKEPGTLSSAPLIVLCNRLSASASEIFAGVIKDYHRGIIIGDQTTHGKGTVQNLMDVAPGQRFIVFKPSDRGKLKLTIQQFYRVNGDSTQNHGVRSDIVLPSKIDHWDLGESFLDHALPFDQVAPVKYSENRMVTPEIISQLSQKSADRIAHSEDFKKVNHSIERYLEHKDQTNLSLNEVRVRKEREEEESVKKMAETEDQAEGQTPKPGEPIFPKGYYEDEVLNIALDYVAALQGKVAASKN